MNEKTATKKNSESRHSSLHEDPLFKGILWATGFCSVAIAAVIIGCNQLWAQFCTTPACFNNVLTIFKLPISVATAGITLAGLYALVFRSRQTALQIETAENALEEASRNNTYANYRAHKEEMCKEFDRIAADFDLVIPDKHFLYNNIFPKNSAKYFAPEGFHNPPSNKNMLVRLVESFNVIDQRLPRSPIDDLQELAGHKEMVIDILFNIFERLCCRREYDGECYRLKALGKDEIAEDMANSIYLAHYLLKDFCSLALLSDEGSKLCNPIETRLRHRLVMSMIKLEVRL